MKFGVRLAVPDHVINAHMQKRTPMLENWTVLSALAVLTKKVKLAGHTFNNSLRHPAVFAKMAATLDVISGGRLLYSLGSAWFEHIIQPIPPLEGMRYFAAEILPAVA